MQCVKYVSHIEFGEDTMVFGRTSRGKNVKINAIGYESKFIYGSRGELYEVDSDTIATMLPSMTMRAHETPPSETSAELVSQFAQDVLEYIFARVVWQSRRSVLAVCRRWYDVASQLYLTRRYALRKLRYYRWWKATCFTGIFRVLSTYRHIPRLINSVYSISGNDCLRDALDAGLPSRYLCRLNIVPSETTPGVMTRLLDRLTPVDATRVITRWVREHLTLPPSVALHPKMSRVSENITTLMVSRGEGGVCPESRQPPSNRQTALCKLNGVRSVHSALLNGYVVPNAELLRWAISRCRREDVTSLTRDIIEDPKSTCTRGDVLRAWQSVASRKRKYPWVNKLCVVLKSKLDKK